MPVNSISKQSILKIFVTGLIFSVSCLLSAQNPASFAGKWEIDHSKSDAEFRDYLITCDIDQSATSVTVQQTFLMKDGSKSSMPPITFSLDGKEVSKEEQGGTNKISAELSPDKKTLATKYVRTMNGNDYGSLTVYTLSDDGRTLTVKSSDLNSESTMIQVYNRK